MRRFIFVLALLPLSAFAQLQQNQQDPALYPYKKQTPPAGGYYYEQQNQGSIPTSGTEQARKVPNSNRNRNSNYDSGPTIIQQGKGRGSPTYIMGPDGTRVCTDAGGRTTVCW